ncbi:MAG: nth [Parachlamydiales bacterium]|nr:nth [Parachlamydiales bacterium]
MKIDRILAILDEYVPDPQIPLHFSDPFTLLIAVILSAQCTDERVNRITTILFERAHTPRQMADLDPQKIEAIIRPCGLAPTKSRAISQLSRDLIEHHNGQVPETLEELEKLPGVGHKTASVVLIHAFHKTALPVDTHIHRCAKRWGLSSGKSVKQTERDLKAAFPKSHWARIHLQMILFARKYCTARGHHPAQCPMCRELQCL